MSSDLGQLRIPILIFFPSTVDFHKRGPLLQTAGHPFPLLLGQPSSALLSTAQAGGPPSVKIGWATKNIIFEDVRVRGHGSAHL